MEYVKGVDLSHWQQKPDFAKLRANGIEFIIVKATERMSVDADLDWNIEQASSCDMPCLAYAFLRPDDTRETAKHFLANTAGLVPCLDWEIAGVSTRVVEMWIDVCEAQLGRKGLCYYGLYPPDFVSDKIANWPRWYPQYPGSATAAPRLPMWDGVTTPDWRKCWLVWQWDGHATLDGLPGDFDLNRLAIPLDAFKQWIATGMFPNVVEPPAPVLAPISDRVAMAKQLQMQLKAAGYYRGVIDGKFGPQSAAALMAYFNG